MPSVQLLVPLLARELDLAGVDDDHDVAIILVRSVRGLVLALLRECAQHVITCTSAKNFAWLLLVDGSLGQQLVNCVHDSGVLDHCPLQNIDTCQCEPQQMQFHSISVSDHATLICIDHHVLHHITCLERDRRSHDQRERPR